MAQVRRQPGAAFTLLELVLVLVLLALVLALSAPSLRGWGRGAAVRSAADEFRAATLAARQTAILTATICRIQFDDDGAGYAVVAGTGDDGQARAVAGEFARPVRLPVGCRIELVNPQGSSTIDFHPTGRCTPATVRIVAAQGESVVVSAESATDLFHFVTEAQS